jgi:asparagine synthase (glutamine-hydrolysing)
MTNFIPEDVTRAEKQGFSAPDASWFKGESIDYVRETLLDPKARIYDYLDFTSATELIDQHLSGSNNRRLMIWSLLSMEKYLEAV